LGREVVVIARGCTGAAIVIDNAAFAEPPPAETWTVKELVPAAIGVPAMFPLEEFRLSPGGNAPEEMDQE